MWNWTQIRIALIQCIDHRRIPREWLLHPQLHILAAAKAPGNSVVLGACDVLRGFLPPASTHDRLYGLHEMSTMENISRQGADCQLQKLSQRLLKRTSFSLGASGRNMCECRVVSFRNKMPYSWQPDDALSQKRTVLLHKRGSECTSHYRNRNLKVYSLC